jgi:hypothetical protein
LSIAGFSGVQKYRYVGEVFQESKNTDMLEISTVFELQIMLFNIITDIEILGIIFPLKKGTPRHHGQPCEYRNILVFDPN